MRFSRAGRPELQTLPEGRGTRSVQVGGARLQGRPRLSIRRLGCGPGFGHTHVYEAPGAVKSTEMAAEWRVNSSGSQGGKEPWPMAVGPDLQDEKVLEICFETR